MPRPAIVLVPARFGPQNPPPPLPVVISPHNRKVRAFGHAKLRGHLPGVAGFVVIWPGGMGRRLPLHSWGNGGQISDLARMPGIAKAGLPWIRFDMKRVYALGGSMGGQETLLLLGQYPQVLAGAMAMDSVTNFHRRYGDFGLAPKTRGVRSEARRVGEEVEGAA